MKIATGLVLLLLLTPAAVGGEVIVDAWYSIHIGDARSGHSHTRSEGPVAEGQQGAKVYVTTTETVLVIARMGSPVTMKFSDRIVEDPSGRVVRFRRV